MSRPRWIAGRRWWVCFVLACALMQGLALTHGLAQEPASEPSSVGETPAEDGPRLVRPPEGMRRGALPVPSWVPISIGATVAVFSALVLARRIRSQKK